MAAVRSSSCYKISARNIDLFAFYFIYNNLRVLHPQYIFNQIFKLAEYKISMHFFYIRLFSFSFAGHGTDYLNLALRDGGVSLTMGLDNGKQEMHIKPARVRFDDHQWHKVTVHRRIQEVVLNAKTNIFTDFSFR